MGRKKEYNLKEIDVQGQGYETKGRIIRNHTNVGILILPKYLIGKKFDVYLIQKEELEII